MEQIMNKNKLAAIASTYFRAAVAAMLALVLVGKTDPKEILLAGVAAVAGPILKALDPSAKDFGRGANL
jgi:hypothetical protein